MIIEKDAYQFFSDTKGNPDILLYEPNRYKEISKYIIENRITKIALCGGGEPTQEYLNSINNFYWLKYINGTKKGLDLNFLNNLKYLKSYIGVIDFELSNNSIEELYITYSSKMKISKKCNKLKKLWLDKCTSPERVFEDNVFPKSLIELTLVNSKMADMNWIPLNSIHKINISHCSKLLSLNGIEKCSKLEKIDIEKCCNLKDISSLELIEQSTDVRIFSCPLIKT